MESASLQPCQSAGYFNAWMTPEALSDTEAYFIESDADTTLTEPGSATRVITVGGYNHYTDSGDVNSSRGYTADNRVKPDIVAPGVDVYGVGGIRGYTRRSGTSVAASSHGRSSGVVFKLGATNKKQGSDRKQR